MYTPTLPEPRRDQATPQKRVACVAPITLLLGCIGCATHVTLPAPPDEAEPHETRVAYCDAMRPSDASMRSAATFVNARGGRRQRMEHGLKLGEGTLVTEADDLIPVVGPSSDAGISAREAASARLVADGASAATVTTFLVGASLLTLQTMPEEVSGLPSELRDGVLTTGVATLAMSSLSVAVVVLASEAEGVSRRRAFSLYEAHFDDDRCMHAHTP